MDILIISKWLYAKHVDTDYIYPDLAKGDDPYAP